MKSEDNKYLHRDFHTSMDNALQYCADRFGADELVGFLQDYVSSFYAPTISEIKANGLVALKAWIEKTYEIEESSELLHAVLTDKKLEVTVDKCPAISYMRSLGQEPSKYFIEETKTVYATVAEKCGYNFKLEYYNDGGGTRFVFEKL